MFVYELSGPRFESSCSHFEDDNNKKTDCKGRQLTITSPSMKPTLTRWGGFSNKEVSPQCINKYSSSERCGCVRQGLTDLLIAYAKDLIQCWKIWIRVASLSLVSFRSFSAWSGPIYFLYQYISSFRRILNIISYRFLSSKRLAGVFVFGGGIR